MNLVTALAIAILNPATATEPRLTGINLHGVNAANGAFDGTGWNTNGSDGAFNLNVFHEGELLVGADARIDIGLTPGVYRLEICGSAAHYGVGYPYAVNLFFDGDDFVPRISAWSLTTYSSRSESTEFDPYGGSSRSLDYSSPVEGALTSTWQSGPWHVELTGVLWRTPGSLDCIGSNGQAPDGYADHSGFIELRVTLKCPVDFNRDGFLDFFDYDDFVVAFETGDPRSDFNGDGFLDFFDYDDFAVGFASGC